MIVIVGVPILYLMKQHYFVGQTEIYIHVNKTLMVFPPKEPLVYKAVPPNSAFHGRDPSCTFKAIAFIMIHPVLYTIKHCP